MSSGKIDNNYLYKNPKKYTEETMNINTVNNIKKIKK
jgi:hypothetical protein